MFDSAITYSERTLYWKRDAVSSIECTVSRADSGGRIAVYVSYGRIPDYGDPIDTTNAYQAPNRENFSVPGVEGEGTVDTAKEGGGVAVFQCDGHYVLVSIYPRQEVQGDLKSNMVNLATSMTPWVCGGETIPGRQETLEELERPKPQSTPTQDA
ncbi:hypothetical protein ACSL103130_01705 [Actinomyces slackii]|uniref:Uncharacterized protein n=2 Tax=Actinomyces slackii TaxID=52774 RepID=A0A3S4WFS9_9ACTO|nr:Uncharacterised protein [Actinomyces slackii]